MASADAGSITRSAGLLGLLTTVSRVLGLVRDTVIAHLFGAGFVSDALVMAFTIPNTFRQLVAEGSLTVAFLPVLAETRAKEGEGATRALIGNALAVFPLLVGGFTIAGMLLAEPLTWLFAAGFATVPGKFELTARLTVWLFPFLWCAAMVALTMGILNSVRRFAIPALAPALFNLLNIVVTLGYYVFIAREVWAAVAGILVGGLAQVVLQVWGLRRSGYWVRPRLALSPPVMKILRLMGPTIVGTSIYEVNIMLMRFFGSHLEQGAITYLYNADRFTQFPLGVFGVAIATAALPSLSDHAAAQDVRQFKETLSYSISLSTFIIIPATVALVVLAEPIITTTFQHGQYTAAMAQATAQALVFYAVGLGAVALMRLVVQGFFALQDTRTPVACSAVGLAANVAGALALVGPLTFRGLALAVSLAAWLQLVLLVGLLSRRVGALAWRSILGSVARSALAAALMGGAVWGLARLGAWHQGTTVKNLVVLLATVSLGVGVYFGVAHALGSGEAAHVWRILRRKFARSRVA